jgi:hypothetical protein
MKHLKRVAVLAVTAAALLVPSTAMAATSPGYEEFSDCPSKNDNPDVGICIVTTVVDGHMKLGSKNTPIEDPIKLTFGATEDGVVVPGGFDGGRQRIPGGLTGLTGLDWLRFIWPFSYLQIYAEPELAGAVSGFGPIHMPLKVHLDNVLLNNNCYIGSNSNPINLNLTTETTSPPPPNTPITGQEGTTTPDPVLPGVERSTGLILVDNAFSVPGATGCDLIGFGLINALVNLQSGLPSAAGNNETVQEAEGALGVIQAIYQPAGFEN